MRSIARTPTRVKALYLCRDNIARFLEDHAETESPDGRPYPAFSHAAGVAEQRTSTQQTPCCPRPLVLVPELGSGRPVRAHGKRPRVRLTFPPHPAPARVCCVSGPRRTPLHDGAARGVHGGERTAGHHGPRLQQQQHATALRGARGESAVQVTAAADGRQHDLPRAAVRLPPPRHPGDGSPSSAAAASDGGGGNTAGRWRRGGRRQDRECAMLLSKTPRVCFSVGCCFADFP
jgi:hypothetical protein